MLPSKRKKCASEGQSARHQRSLPANREVSQKSLKKDREVPARVITRWRESGSGAEVQARAGKRGNSEARTPVAQENNNSLSANINSPDSLFPRC